MLSPTKLDTLRGKAGAVLNSTFPFTKETLVNKYSVISLYQSCNSKLTQFAPKIQRKNILWKVTTIFFFQYYMNAKIFQCYSFWKPRQKKKTKTTTELQALCNSVSSNFKVLGAELHSAGGQRRSDN